MDTQNFCLKWEGFQSNVTSLFNDLRQEDELVDITLCCEGERIGAHRMMLSACSPYFRDVLKNNPCPHMVFYMKDTSASNLRALVEFMYKGSVNVAQSQLASFIKTAESLQIRGLSGDRDQVSPPPPPPPPPVQRRPPAAAAVVQEYQTYHRRSASASQEHRLSRPSSISEASMHRPSLPVPSPPAKRRRHVSSEFMAAVSISASAPSVISTPSDTELNNVTSAPSAVDFSDAAASKPVSPSYVAFNQSARSPHRPIKSPSAQPDEDYGIWPIQEQQPMKTENLKIEKIDLTEGDDDGSLEATLGQVAEYEGFDDSGQPLDGSASHGMSMQPFMGDLGAGSSQMMPGEDGNSQGSHNSQHICLICGRGYRHRESYLHHQKQHQGLTKCMICGRVLSSVANLRSHMLLIHNMTKDQIGNSIRQ